MSSNIKKSSFIDGLLSQSKLREESITKAIEYIEHNIGAPDIFEENYDDISTIHSLLTDIRRVCCIDEDELNDGDCDFRRHVKKNLVISHGKYYTLTTPVFSYTKSSSGVYFLLHILLSMGSFDT